MGTPKAALEWHGSTLLRRTTGILARVTDGPVLVVRAPGQELPALVLHGLVGLALVAGSVSLAVRAVATRARQAAVPAVTAAVALLVAASGGLRFLGTGAEGASLVMALCAAIAIGCYGLILYWGAGE